MGEQGFEQQHTVEVGLAQHFLALLEDPRLTSSTLAWRLFCARYCSTLRMSARPSPSSSWVS
jgi:hypothetical protein